MNEELKAKLLNKKWVGGKLKEFRVRYGFGTVKAAQSETGLTGLGKNEDGTQFPSWETLVKLTSACGKDVSDFIADLEPQRAHSSGVEIVRNKEHLYGMLTTILKSKNPHRVHGITVNLEDISAAAKREMAGADGDTAQSMKEKPKAPEQSKSG